LPGQSGFPGFRESGHIIMKTHDNPKRRKRRAHEAGAVAVEFALVLPIFLALVLGIAEFGRAFNTQVSLTEAGREAARYAAIHCSETGYSASNAQAAGVAAAPSVALIPANIGISYSGTGTCSAGNNAVVTVTYTTPWMTGFPALIPGMPANLSIQGKGVMRCGG
jgi:Flp pilus assembly protein TadG